MSKPLEDLWAWLKVQIGDKAALLIVAAASVVFGVGWARGEVREAAHDEVDPVRLEQERQRRVMERYEQDVHEFRKDVRELYRVTPWVRPSPRLESPLVGHDGGHDE